MENTIKTIRIDDLRRPILTNAHRRELETLKDLPVELSEQAVLSAARDRTGLDDFGQDAFRERLQTWLAEIAADPNRSQLGRMMMFRRCVRWASTRLRLQELLRCHPEIHETQLRRPIIVVGLPRTGTTHLVNLLANDPRLRSLPLWESYDPIPAPNTTPIAETVDPRRVRCEKKWHRMQQLLPLYSAMHPMDPDHVTEELELQGPDFSASWLQTAAHVPRWAARYSKDDQTPHYEYMKTMLKALQWQRGPSRWVLKSPIHAEQLGPLMATFPDSTVVMTHRDPVKVIQSALTMIAYFARLEFYNVDTNSIASYWLRRIENMLLAMVRDRALIPQKQLVDVNFHEFVIDEIGTARRVYQEAGLAFRDQDSKEISAFLAGHPRDVYGRVVYNLMADFDINPDDLRTKFEFYYKHFPVKVGA